MKILVVDDSGTMRSIISKTLKELGLTDLTLSDSAENAEHLLTDRKFDLILLDWHMGGMSGLELLRLIKSRDNLKNIPVIMLTVEKNHRSVKEAIDSGADDYMVKPVNKAVTLARIKALQRRHTHRQPGVDRMPVTNDALEPYAGIDRFDPFEINHQEHTIAVSGKVVKLTNKEFELAAYLFKNAGCLVSRDHLLEHIWGMRPDLNTRTVDTHISRIRSKLGINPAAGWQLSSIYQRGYRLFRVTAS